MVLAIVWAQIAIDSCYEGLPPGPPAGRVSAWARRKDPDEESDPRPDARGRGRRRFGRAAHEWWIDAARKAGIDLSGFDPAAPLAERIAWAIQAGLEIAAVLSRFSSKLQHSTTAQVQHNVEYAGKAQACTPPRSTSALMRPKRAAVSGGTG